MRTTLTLDDDIAKQLPEKARRSGESFKEVVNETLRRGLRSGEKPSRPASSAPGTVACRLLAPRPVSTLF